MLLNKVETSSPAFGNDTGATSSACRARVRRFRRCSTFLGRHFQITAVLRGLGRRWHYPSMHHDCYCLLGDLRNAYQRVSKSPWLSDDYFVETTVSSLGCRPGRNSQGTSSHMRNHPSIASKASTPRSAEFWCVSGAAKMALCLLSQGLLQEIKALLS